MQMPKVSVVLTSFNHEKYVGEAIDSILNQSFNDFELIVWDDASTDDSWSVIKGYKDPRIKAFRNEKNCRPIVGVIKAISEVAAGEYIAMHHSDDAWAVDKLEKQVALLDANQDLGAVFTWVQIIDEHGVKSEETWFDQENRSRWEWLNCLFLGQNRLNHPSVLIRRRCYQEVGIYRYGFAQTGDAEMWSRVLQKFSIHIIQEKLTMHRRFSDKSNTSGGRVEALIRTSNEWNVLRENYLSLSRFEDIVAIFPNLDRFRNPEGFDSKFLLAMACLYECKQRNAWQQGLKWLFELINDPDRREKIRVLYSFSYLDFIRLTGEFDAYFAEGDKQIAERDGLIAEREARIKQIYASRSWRLTKPLRLLERLARSGLNRQPTSE
jgi:glycosyltransferase involved in cell wall biosynthesis